MKVFQKSASSDVFHSAHHEFASYEDATAAGLRPCGVCKPQPSPVPNSTTVVTNLVTDTV